MTDQSANDKAKVLLEKYLNGNCSEEEQALIEQWYLTLGTEPIDLTESALLEDFAELRETSIAPVKTYNKLRFLLPLAAAIAVLFMTVLLWQWKVGGNIKEEEVTLTQDFAPGSNKAILSIEGEADISLSGGQEALVSDGDLLSYSDGTSIKALESVRQVKLSTPVAGQYKVQLPDNTVVWLNALSSISYPTVFAQDERRVTVTGEVYFEVSPDKNKPFIVETTEQRIEVIGTSFNLDAYGDNGNTLTTLVEGSLIVERNDIRSNVLLKPGEQSIVSTDHKIVVKKVNVDEESSWKDGLYIVHDASLAQYAKKIERWYDVQIDMGSYADESLSAIIPRNAKLSEVLQAIELKTGVKFVIEERRVMAIN